LNPNEFTFCPQQCSHSSSATPSMRVRPSEVWCGVRSHGECFRSDEPYPIVWAAEEIEKRSYSIVSYENLAELHIF